MLRKTAIINYAVVIMLVGGMLGISSSAQVSVAPPTSNRVVWNQVLKQEQPWYGEDEAMRVADNVLAYQRTSGGWPKNIDMAAVLSANEVAALVKQKPKSDSNIDNGATYTQLIFLARVFEARKLERHKEAFLHGLDYLIKAQYANGGWPQYYPGSRGYYAHITFNDGAMIGVMKVLRDIAQEKAVYSFVDSTRREQARQAVQKGTDCILKSQVKVRDQLTVWGGQHDEVTLAPAAARAFEPVSLASAESVGIVRFLMSIKNPTQPVIDAVDAAVNWFHRSKIAGIRWVETPDPKSGGFDRVAVKDKNAEPIWARFYELETNRGIFIGRDGVVKYNVDEIEAERRNGYNWYVDEPAELLSKEYPAWRQKLLRNRAQ